MIASSTEKIKSARTLAFEALYEIFEKNSEYFAVVPFKKGRTTFIDGTYLWGLS